MYYRCFIHKGIPIRVFFKGWQRPTLEYSCLETQKRDQYSTVAVYRFTPNNQQALELIKQRHIISHQLKNKDSQKPKLKQNTVRNRPALQARQLFPLRFTILFSQEAMFFRGDAPIWRRPRPPSYLPLLHGTSYKIQRF